MSGTGTPMVVTPKKKSSNRARCVDCPCKQFQSDETITTVVDSDARVEALIGWLSGDPAKNDDGRRSETGVGAKIICPNRLQASIVILNAIRDACRPYLESSTSPSTSTITTSSTPPRKDAEKEPTPPSLNGVSYEDSFPSLSSVSSTAPPTILVGRKKNKGPTKSAAPFNSTTFAYAASTAAPTVLVGRKKTKGPKNNKQPSNLGSYAIKSIH